MTNIENELARFLMGTIFLVYMYMSSHLKCSRNAPGVHMSHHSNVHE